LVEAPLSVGVGVGVALGVVALVLGLAVNVPVDEVEPLDVGDGPEPPDVQAEPNVTTTAAHAAVRSTARERKRYILTTSRYAGRRAERPCS